MCIVNDINQDSVLFAICGVDTHPWNKIFSKGTLTTWLSRVEETDGVWLVRGTRPNRAITFLNSFIENWRWNSGKTASYFLAYTLMAILLPLRCIVPKLREVLGSDEVKGATYKVMKFRFPELILSLRWKKIAIAKEFLESTQFPFLVIANPSTYIILSRLREFLSELKAKGPEACIYSGMVANSADSAYIVGSFIILNRCAAEELVNNRIRIPVHTIDDVAIGDFFSRLGVEPIVCPSLVIQSDSDLEVAAKASLDTIINFKIKSITGDRAERDVELLRSIDEYYSSVEE